MSDPSDQRAPRKSFLMRVICFAFRAVTSLILILASVWSFGALWFDFPDPVMGPWVAGAFLLMAVLVAALLKPYWRAKLVIAVGLILVAVWWFTIQPRQYRDWKTEVALLPHATMDGDAITIFNIRDFDYRTDKDFTARYETKTYQLSNLRGADVFINYWGSPYMAHPIVSFDFGVDGRVCFSIETRPEKGEGYSAIRGLYRQFELIYVVADERDVVRLRTNYRKGEDVYLYRLKAKRSKEAFLEYVHSINELKQSPRWYNAISNNCTTAIRHQRAASERAPWDWRMLANGYADELLYERKGIDDSMPFSELKKISRINDRAKAADKDADFSAKIREGLPGM